MKALMLMLVIGFWGGFVDCFRFLAYDLMISCSSIVSLARDYKGTVGALDVGHICRACSCLMAFRGLIAELEPGRHQGPNLRLGISQD